MKNAFRKAVEILDQGGRKIYGNGDYRLSQEFTAYALVVPSMGVALACNAPNIALAGFLAGAVGGTWLGRRAYERYNGPDARNQP